MAHPFLFFLISALWILSQRQSRVTDADLARRQDFRVPASPALQGFQELLATLFPQPRKLNIKDLQKDIISTYVYLNIPKEIDEAMLNQDL